jgi:hypothetical protein
MCVRFTRLLAASLGAALAVHLAAAADGPRVLIMEGGKHRLLLVDRASKATIAENNAFGRIECLAALGDEFIVCEGASFVRVDGELKERSRTPMAFEHIGSVSAAGGDRLLVSDTAKNFVEEIDGVGNRLWSIGVHYPSAAVRLANGNTLVADGTADLKEFDPTGGLARHAPLRSWAASLQQLASGETLVGESRAYERLDAAGKSIWARESASRVSCIQELSGGEILLCEPDSHRVAIVDVTGRLVWELTGLDYAWRAIYLQ